MADEYHEESITPFASGVEFRFGTDIDRVLADWGRSSRVVVDFGCGPGDSWLPLLGRASIVAALDFAPRMIEVATHRAKKTGTTAHEVTIDDLAARAETTDRTQERTSSEALLVQGDLRDLSPLANRIDLAT